MSENYDDKKVMESKDIAPNSAKPSHSVSIGEPPLSDEIKDGGPGTETGSRRRLSGFLFLLTLSVYLCQPNYEPALFEHLTIGRYVAGHHLGPNEFIWSTISKGHPWSSPSVILEAALGSLFSLGDFKAILVFKLCLYLFAVFSIARTFRRAAGDSFFAGLIATIAVAGFLVSGEFNPQLPGAIGFSVILSLLLEPPRWKITAGLAIGAVLVTLLGITPAGAVAGLTAVALAAIGPKKERSAGESVSKIARPIVVPVFLVTAFAAFVAPFSGQFATEMRQRLNEASYLADLQVGQLHFDYGDACLVLLILLGLILSFSASNAADRSWFKRVDLRLILFALFFWPTADYLLPYALIGCGFYVCRIWSSDQSVQLSKIGEGFVRLHSSLARTPEPGSSFLLICLSIVSGFSLLQTPVVYIGMPNIEAERILQRRYPGPVLTEPAVSGYLMQKFSQKNGSPRLTVFPSRTDLATAPQAAAAAAKTIFGKPGEADLDQLKAGVILIRTSLPLAKSLKAAAESAAATGTPAKWRLDSVDGRPIEIDPEKQLPSDYKPLISWSVFVRN